MDTRKVNTPENLTSYICYALSAVAFSCFFFLYSSYLHAWNSLILHLCYSVLCSTDCCAFFGVDQPHQEHESTSSSYNKTVCNNLTGNTITCRRMRCLATLKRMRAPVQYTYTYANAAYPQPQTVALHNCFRKNPNRDKTSVNTHHHCI